MKHSYHLDAARTLAKTARLVRANVLIWCYALLINGLISQGVAAASELQMQSAKIDQAVITSLPVWHGNQAQVLAHLDLTLPFTTRSQWTLVVAQDPTPPPADIADMQEHGPIAVCFVKALSPTCTERYGDGDEFAWYFTTYSLIDDRVVYAGEGSTQPLLWLKTCSASTADGNCNIRAVLFTYDLKSDRFLPVFVHDTGGSNNNQNARFVEKTSLRGDVIVDYPTEHAPYRYWIEVYGRAQSGQYVRILKYRGYTGYGDGNPLPVGDSEMPEILRHLGYWRLGDALPVPTHMPSSCTHLYMRNGEEWCE